jgi:hypothetical protein
VLIRNTRLMADIAVLDAKAARKVLADMGLELEQPPVGCCGLAGSFGYEVEHHEVSMQIGEHVLLPKVRKLPRQTLMIADGFSCRQQIKHGTGRWPMHPAEVIALALETQGRVPADVPERRFLEAPAKATTGSLLAAAGLGAALGVIAVGLGVRAVRSASSRR